MSKPLALPERPPVDIGLPPLVSLDDAAVALGITPTDAANPARHVRDLLRRHGVPFVRCGRTVKLRPDHVKVLAERMAGVRPAPVAPEPVQPRAKRLKALSYIYFIRCGDLVKVGVSIDPRGRLAALQTGNSTKLELLHCEHGDETRERVLHSLFAGQHERGEWFRYEGAVRDFLEGKS